MRCFEYKDVFKPLKDFDPTSNTVERYISENLKDLEKKAEKHQFIVINNKFLPDLSSCESFDKYLELVPRFKEVGHNLRLKGVSLAALLSPKIDFSKRGHGLLHISYMAWLFEQMELDNSNYIITSLGGSKDLTALAARFANKLSHKAIGRLCLKPSEPHSITDLIYFKTELQDLTNIKVPILNEKGSWNGSPIHLTNSQNCGII